MPLGLGNKETMDKIKYAENDGVVMRMRPMASVVEAFIEGEWQVFPESDSRDIRYSGIVNFKEGNALTHAEVIDRITYGKG